MADLKGGVTDTMSWLFENAADAQERVEKAIIATLQQRQIPNKVKKKTYKGGTFFAKTTKDCLCIDGDKSFEIVISCIKFGSYLHVRLFLDKKKGFFSLLARMMQGKDLFRAQKRDAILSGIVDCCETAFVSTEIWDKCTTKN